MAKVLLVEDDNDLAEVVSDFLRAEHYHVDVVASGTDGQDRLKFYDYDVIVLDWNVPGISGVELCREYRASGGETPIIMLTGKKAIAEKEEGLDSGADDYLTKPFHMRELSARLRTLLRRASQSKKLLLSAGDIVLDPRTYTVTKKGAEVELLPAEFALLEFFMRYPNQVFSTEALLNRVWKTESEASPEALRTTLKRLRKKIDNQGEESIIRSIYGVGYKLKTES